MDQADAERYMSMGFTRENSEAAAKKFGSNTFAATEWLTAQPAVPVGQGALITTTPHASQQSQEDELQQAISASLQDSAIPSQPETGPAGDDAQLQQALMYSMQTAKENSDVLIQTQPKVSPVDLVKSDPNLPCGLQNVGNTCYVNTFLQVYYNIPAFRSLILGVVCEKESFLHALQLTFVRMRRSQKKFLDPTEVLKLMKDAAGSPYKVGRQEDVAEFNDTFLANVEEGLRQADSNLDALRSLVEGTSVETYRVPEKNFEKRNTDKYRTVVLPVTSHSDTLFDLLDDYTAEEHIVGYKYDVDCEEGGTTEVTADQAEKSVFFKEDLAGVLVFQLQRAAYISGSVVKNNQQVRAPLHLNLSRYVSENEATTRATSRRVQVIRSEIKEVESKLHTLLDVEGTGHTLSSLLDIAEKRLEGGSTAALREAFTLIRTNAAPEATQLETLQTKHAGCKRKLEEVSSYTEVTNIPKAAYILSGMLMHDGADAVSGHYWACIRKPGTNEWWKYNDREVSSLSADEVSVLTHSTQNETSSSTVYCMVYTCEDLQDGVQGCGIEDALLEQVDAENAAHSEAVKAWEESMASLAPLLTAAAEEHSHAIAELAEEKASGEGCIICVADLVVAIASADEAEGVTLSLSIDKRLTSRYSFALQKYQDGESVLKVLPIAEAYNACFKSDLISDWQGSNASEHTARAEEVAAKANIASLLYTTKTQITSLRTAHETFIAASGCFLKVISILNKKKRIGLHENHMVVWAYLKERDRLDACWRDERHIIVMVELLVRWVQQVCVSCQYSSPQSLSVTEPLGLIARYANSLSVPLAETIREYALSSLSKATHQRYSAAMFGKVYVAKAPTGKTPDSASHSELSAAELAAALLEAEGVLYASLDPITIGFLEVLE